MRIDGRENYSLRPYAFNIGFIPWSAGSVLTTCGQTMVLCTVSIENKVPPHCIDDDKGWITAEYAMLPHSGMSRSSRDGRPKVKGRSIEIQRMIGRSLRAGINLYALNGLTFIVDCDVIKADGGTRTTAITGSWIALCLALNKYFNGSIPPEVFKSPFIGAVSVGLIDGEVLLDLNYEEDSKADVDLNLVGSYPSGWVEIQGTSESEPMEFDLLNDMISVGRNGLKKIFKLQKEILEHNQIVYE